MPNSLPIARLAEQWIRRLLKQMPDALPARDLYSGDHWHAVRSIIDHPPTVHRTVQVWVCSAGYGLVPVEAPVAAYSATFTPGDPESVCHEGGRTLRDVLPVWWATLARQKPDDSGPKTIADIARMFPEDFLLVALPSTYLTAVQIDLENAIRAIRSSDQLAILSVGGTGSTGLLPNFLSADARLRTLVGGSLNALNARLARLLISELGHKPVSLERCRRFLSKCLESTPQLIVPNRIAASDKEIKSIIRKYLAEDPRAAPTPSLKRFRDGGMACEQKRFVALFKDVREGRHAGIQ